MEWGGHSVPSTRLGLGGHSQPAATGNNGAWGRGRARFGGSAVVVPGGHNCTRGIARGQAREPRGWGSPEGSAREAWGVRGARWPPRWSWAPRAGCVSCTSFSAADSSFPGYGLTSVAPAYSRVLCPSLTKLPSLGRRVFRCRVVQAGRLNYKRHYSEDTEPFSASDRSGYL